MKRTAAHILEEGAKTFAERNKVYGDNYLKVGAVLAVLFPNGIKLETPDDHNRFHLFMLSIVKITRYAENWNRGGHQDSVRDATVYMAMVEAVDEAIESNRTVKIVMKPAGEEIEQVD